MFQGWASLAGIVDWMFFLKNIIQLRRGSNCRSTEKKLPAFGITLMFVEPGPAAKSFDMEHFSWLTNLTSVC
jgi:hypothetical protein